MNVIRSMKFLRYLIPTLLLFGALTTEACFGATGPVLVAQATRIFLPVTLKGAAEPPSVGTPTATSTTVPIETPTVTPTPTIPTAPADNAGVLIGLALPQTLQADTQALRQLGVEAIYAASRAAGTGSVVTTGTVTVKSDGSLAYAQSPTDRLNFVLADGQTGSVLTSEIQGDFTGDASAFLSSAHRFNARILTGASTSAASGAAQFPVNVDVQLVSHLNSGQFSVQVAGQMTQDGQTYVVDLRAEGTTFFESSFGGLEERLDFRMRGTVNSIGGGPSLILTVDERYVNELVVADGESASTANTEIRNSWSHAGVDYAITDGLVQRSFRNGRPSQLDTYWHASGRVLRNGEPVGTLALIPDAVYVRVVVQLPGETLEVQRFQR